MHVYVYTYLVGIVSYCMRVRINNGINNRLQLKVLDLTRRRHLGQNRRSRSSSGGGDGKGSRQFNAVLNIGRTLPSMRRNEL